MLSDIKEPNIETLLYPFQITDSSCPSKQINKKQKNTSQCPLCEEPCLEILISNALYHKHTQQRTAYNLKQLEQIQHGIPTKATVWHKQYQVLDEEEQVMRRMYQLTEYQYKNKALAEYYKFHVNYPKFFQAGVDRILEKYYDRKKDYEYKKIKRILKEEEDISITTQKSSSMFSDQSEVEKKSKYSDMLGDLTQIGKETQQQVTEQNQSKVLQNICQKIDKAYSNKPLSPIMSQKKNYHMALQRKGKNAEDNQTKNFIKYLKEQEKKILKKSNNQGQQGRGIKSNKQSKYNSIQQEVEKYSKKYSSSGLKNKKENKIKHISFKKTPLFYDGNLFFAGGVIGRNSNLLGREGKKNEEKTTKDFNSNEIIQMDKNVNPDQRAFKKRKNSFNNYKVQQNQYDNLQFSDNKFRASEFKNANDRKLKYQKSTQQIYRNAVNKEMRLKKRAVSYNSLAQTYTKKSITSTSTALKQKNLELIRNRTFSQNYLKDPNRQFERQIKPDTFKNPAIQARIQRAKSLVAFRGNYESERKNTKMKTPTDRQRYNSDKKPLSRETIQRGSVGKLIPVHKLSRQKYNSVEKLPIKFSQNHRSIPINNLFIQEQIRDDTKNKQGTVRPGYRALQVQNLLQKKLLVKGHPPEIVKSKKNKILI